MAIITISRQVGSGGEELARRVADSLKYRYFDKQLLIKAADGVGMARDQVVDYSEDRYEVLNFVGRLLRSGPRPVKTVSRRERDAQGNVTPSEETVDEGQHVELVKRSIRAAGDMGDIVIVGRGGQAVLQDHANTLHVRVIAPVGSRIARLQATQGLSVEAAQQLIAQRDRATAEYLGRFFGIRWDDCDLYHLVLNTGKLDLNGAAQLIIDAVVQLRAGIATG